MAPPISLTIVRQGDTNIIDLAEVGTLIPRSEIRVDDAFLQEVNAEITSVATLRYGREEGGTVVRNLQRIGVLLFSHLLTEAARQRLRTAEPCEVYLRLDERLVHIPWELCYDGEQFLALKFRLGRQVITSAPLPGTAAIHRGQGPLRVLLIADPTETLPQASQETEQLCELLGCMWGVEVTLLGGSAVRKVPLLAALQSHEVVHFAGHSQYDAQTPSHSGWLLHEGLLTAEELGKLSRPPLLVFSNSCQGGATAAWPREARYEGQAFGIGSAFLLAGVQNYISTFWRVQDEESTLFATAFYRSLTAGQRIGEALCQARQATIAQRGWAGLTWASYMLYGDPAFTLLPTTTNQVLPLSFVAEQLQPVGVLQRKLAAILSADVKGYSRLMGEDEVATIRSLTAYRQVMTALILQHHGRVVDAPGDNLLAEFASAVDAVRCAVEIQEALKIRNAELLPNRRMEFRIGINVGDVISEGERLYGDGVNIAARLEALAEGGGICISGTVYDQVETKLALRYESLGEQTVKNITKPVRVYRVLASIPPTPPVASSQEQSRVQSLESRVQDQHFSATPSAQHLAPNLVGRDRELTQLRQWFEKALNGERQIIFITGEPGIGKTTLVDAFLFGVRSDKKFGVQTVPPRTPNPELPSTLRLLISHGQCIEHYGAGEAYLPVLTALGQLCREPGGQRLVEILGQYAPTWLVQMPALLTAADLDALQRKTVGATRERMLREMAEALEALTAERPLVLWLEDLHWSDYSTLDLLAFLARRRQPARLLVIGTSRPVEGQEHPLWTVKHELQLHGQCQEVALGFLIERDVADYLAARFARPELPTDLTRAIHQRTEGNPLFMVNVVDELVAQGRIDGAAVELTTPVTIRQMIEQNLERLTVEEQHVIEAASVAGMEFSAAAVASGLEADEGEIEERCTGLARRNQLLRACGTEEWPDGTVAARYGFIHALYHEVVYERVTATRRVRLHQRIGERLEAAYGKQAREVAAELAVHFERGREYRRAVEHLRQAGQNAIRRAAHQEAIILLNKGLKLLTTWPDTPEHTLHELTLLTNLGPALIATKGYGAPEVEHTFARAYELCQQGGSPPQLISILQGLHMFYFVRGELRKAQDLAEQIYQLAQRVSTPTALMVAHGALGVSLFRVGELTDARAHLEQAWSLRRPQEHEVLVIGSWGDPGVSYLSHIAVILWYLGYPDQALKHASAALRLAHEGAYPFSLAFALAYAASMDFLLQEVQASQEHVEALIALATDQQFPDWLALGTAMRGAGFVKQGKVKVGMDQLQKGLAEMQALGQEIGRPAYLAYLAEAYGEQGQMEEGLGVMEEALAALDRIGERYYEAEMYRGKGELTLQSKGLSPRSQVEKAAERCFWQAIEMAHQQHAKSWELRAVMSLSRLWQQQGKREEARKLLAEVYNWFTEGFDTADLKEAKALLDALEDREVESQGEKSGPKHRARAKKAKKEPKPQWSAAIRPEAGATVLGVSGEKVPALTLPDKPSLVVLPFVNLSGDPGQDYFSDGFTEILTSDLSQISGLFVISRNSAFTYKGKGVTMRNVSQELGVQYVLEGSIQKAGDRVRISVQLIDALRDHHVWSERYDRSLSDIFAVQDEVIQKIVTTLKLQLTLQELGVSARRHTDNLEAYDAFLRGMEHFLRYTKEANAQAQRMFENALVLDPQYAEAYVWLGWTYYQQWVWRWSANPQTLERASGLAHQALALNDALPVAHSLLSSVYVQKQQPDQAITEGERAIALAPNDADSYALQAEALCIAGKPEEALRRVEQAVRLNPRYPPFYLVEMGLAYRLTGQYAEAIVTLKEAISRSPDHLGAHLNLATSYLGQWVSQQSAEAQTLEEALAAAQRGLALNDSLHLNHVILGYIYLYQQQYEQALAEVERGVTLAPNEVHSYVLLAVVLSHMGRSEQALEAAAQALCRKPIIAYGHLAYIGIAYAVAGHYEEARTVLLRSLSYYPNFLPSHLMLAAVYNELGQAAEARAEAAEVLRLNPNFSLKIHKQRMPIQDPVVLERHLVALRKAGLK